MPDVPSGPREERIKRIISREYRIFKEEEMLRSTPRTLFERACKKCEKLGISSGKKGNGKLQEAIDFCHLNVTPKGVMSFTVAFALITIIIIGGLMLPNIIFPVTTTVDDREVILGGMFPQYQINESSGEPILNKNGNKIIIGGSNILPNDIGMFLLVIVFFFIYYIYAYPFHLKRKYIVETSGDLVTMVLYMAMFMRNVPSLEGAVKFTSENISGYLGYEIKKMLWDVEVGNFLSMQEALLAYSKKWESNREFVESIELMITSLTQVGEKRIKMLDESVDLMLEGTKEKARNFNQQLKLPVMVVHALGIILPVMGLVLFPIISIFLGIGATMLFMGYDVILPLVLYFVIIRILESRPITLSKIDITENPDAPPPGKFFMGKKAVRAWPIGLVVGAAIILLGIFAALSEMAYVKELAEPGVKFQGMIPSLIITFGIAMGFGIYFLLIAKTRTRIRSETRQVENEFAEALFQLGSQISGGSPIEISIERSMDRIGNLKIKNLFLRSLNNMKMLGYTFEQSFFDPQYGAIRYYPSKMIKSVMKTVIESTKKGVNTAAHAMMSVSRYLKGLHSTQEDVKEELSDTTNSLKFQAYFLSPMISGVIVTMALIIIQILQQLHLQSLNMGTFEGFQSSLFAGINLTPFEFILVVGIYLIESSFILALFISEIESGDDDTGLKKIAGTALIMGFVVFIMIFFFTYMLFQPLITQIA